MRRERWRIPAIAAGLVLLVAGLAIVLRGSGSTAPAAAEAPACPAIAAANVLIGDTDGDGCDEATEVDGNVLVHDGVRFAVGEEGDVPILGDWDCDGLATPGVVRRATNEAHLFDGWAPEGQELPAVRTVAVHDGQPPATDC